MARSFLDLLYGSKDDNSFLLIWEKGKKSKKSHWFTEVGEAEKRALELSEKSDVYFGIGLSPSNKGANNRVEAKEVIAIPGLWIDIDYQGEAHKKGNLPETEADALTLINSMPCKPSIIVHSGHGFQAYWLFSQLAKIDTLEARVFYSQLCERWQRHMKTLASAKGWDVDSTYDLARVFRVPRTFNHKTDEAVEVKMLKVTNNRYEPEQLEAILNEVSEDFKSEQSDGKQEQKKEAVKHIDGLVLDPTADYSGLKFDALCSVEPRFKQSWERKRKDFKDQSASSYDLSLATFAAQANWTDQEIANLLIASRRKHGDDLKLREDYYKNTIAHARISAHKEAKVAKAISAPISDNKDENLLNVSETLGVRIIRIVKYATEPPEYVIYLTGKRQVEVKSDAFLNQNKMRQAMFESADVLIESRKTKEWNEVVTKMLASTETIKMGADTTHLGVVSHWLYRYLRTFKPELGGDESQHNRALKGKPAFIAGDTCIDIDAFMRFITSDFNEKPQKTVLTQRLKRLGLYGCKKAIRAEGEPPTSRYLWVVPKDFVKDHEAAMDAALSEDLSEDAA